MRARAFAGLGGALRAGLGLVPWRMPLFSVARALPLPRAVTRRLPIEGPFRVAVDGSAGFRLLGHGLSAESDLFWRGLEGHEERESLRLWVRLARRARVIVDVGAHIGLYAFAASAVNPGALVFGFEPLPSAFAIFEANCTANDGRVRPVRAAVGNRDGFADLYFGDDGDVASLGRPDGRTRTCVPIRSLRSFLGEQGVERVDLLKIDVETFEPDVLAGLGDLLHRCRPAMLVEVLHDDVGAALERLCPADYVFFHIDERRGPVRAERVARVNHESRNYLLRPAASHPDGAWDS
jgi:FkbM family methyltransferase